jgi:sigma-B regulation protein RsbU (phosphoserine phosphatase)
MSPLATSMQQSSTAVPVDASAPPPPGGGRELSYQTKLIAGVCLLVLLTGAVIIWLAQRSARATSAALADSLFREVSGHAVTQTQTFVERAAPLVESLAQLAGNGLAIDDHEALGRQLLAVLKANAGLSWVSYGDESGRFTGAYRPAEGGLRINQSEIVEGKTRLVEYDVPASGEWQVHRRDDDSGYDPRTRPYYKKAKEAGRIAWLPPYVFYNQGVPGISCAIPVYNAADGTKTLVGVFSVDFDLNALSDFYRRLSVSENSELFLFTSDEVLLAHPNQRIMNASGQRGAGKLLTLRDTGDPLVDAFRASAPAIDLEDPKHGNFRSFELDQDGQSYLASATTFRVGDDLTWVVGAVAPKSDFLGDVWRSQALTLAAAAAALLVAVLLAYAMARRVSGPVQSLIGFMGRVGEGDLNTRADFGGSLEFRRLSTALNQMIADLRDRLRLRHSLHVAMEVQQRLLPAEPPKLHGLDVAGHSTYCDETGGDYYDFLVLEEDAPDRVLLALGDVMGHGVAAALVMAGARAVLRDRAVAVGSLADVLERLNRTLAADLGGERFMTMHLSVIDTRAHTMRWVSAGHDPAMIFDPVTDRIIEIDEAGLPLGVADDSDYEEHTYGPLRAGQVIVVGTDGVWEAANAAGDTFGKDRLREVIRTTASRTADEIVKAVLAALNTFRGQQRATDDVTFVVAKVGQT